MAAAYTRHGGHPHHQARRSPDPPRRDRPHPSAGAAGRRADRPGGCRRAHLDRRERHHDAEDRARDARREEVERSPRSAGSRRDARGARMGRQNASPITRSDAVWSHCTAGSRRPRCRACGACQIHIAPTPASHGPARAPQRSTRAERRGVVARRPRQPEEDERRDDQHQEQVLEHVRAEEVPAREGADRRREREEEEQRRRATKNAASRSSDAGSERR